MNFTRRHFLQAGSAASLGALAIGCDKIEVPTALRIGPRDVTVPDGPYTVPTGNEIDLVSHALNRLTFGPRPWDYHRTRKLGDTEQAAFDAQVSAVDIDADCFRAQADYRAATVVERLSTATPPRGR